MMAIDLKQYHIHIGVRVLEGGFILSYPEKIKPDDGHFTQVDEIFTSQQKLSKKIKEVLDSITSEDETPQ
jgi:hypothetical protein